MGLKDCGTCGRFFGKGGEMKREKWLKKLAKLEWQLNRDFPELNHQNFSRFAREVLELAEKQKGKAGQ